MEWSRASISNTSTAGAQESNTHGVPRAPQAKPSRRSYRLTSPPSDQIVPEICMFYDALKADHGLPHDPTNALVAPRPIGCISSLSKNGVRNLAPYSYFNLVASRPPIVMFGSGYVKDTQRN